MDENGPRGLTLSGAVVAAAGVIVLLFHYGRSSGDGSESFVGGLLVLGGLLLRIAGAIWALGATRRDR